LSVLLIDEGYCDVLWGVEERWVQVLDVRLVGCPKDEAVEVDAFGLAQDLRFWVFAGSHSKKESSNDNVGYEGGSRVLQARVMGRFQQFSQQPRCDRFLAVHRRIYVGEGSEQCFDGWAQVLVAFDVNGTWFEIVPKRRSQTACGSPESVWDQWLRMSCFQSSCDTPFSSAIEVKEGANEEALGLVQ
jgi:hypothetical protein